MAPALGYKEIAKLLLANQAEVVRISVTGKGFDPAEVGGVVQDSTAVCEADLTLFKQGQHPAGRHSGALGCEEPTPYATMLSFRTAD